MTSRFCFLFAWGVLCALGCSEDPASALSPIGQLTENEVVEYCENVQLCYDDAVPCTSLREQLNSESCGEVGHALVGCVLDHGEVTVCEGDQVPCRSEFAAFYACE